MKIIYLIISILSLTFLEAQIQREAQIMDINKNEPIENVLKSPPSSKISQKQESLIKDTMVPTLRNETSVEIIEEKKEGKLNWTEQYIEAKGESAIDYERFKNPAQAKAMATRGAVVIAQRNLLEIIKGVNVVGETSVQDMITSYDYVYNRVEGVLKGAKRIGPAIERDGMIEVTLRAPLYNKKGLASAINEEDLNSLKSKYGQKMATDNSMSLTSSNGKNPVVFDFKDPKVDLSLFPLIMDENGTIQYDFSELYNRRTGDFPRYVQLGKELMQSAGFKKGVEVIELIQKGKGQFTLKDNNKKGLLRTALNVAKTVGRILFNIPFK
jgi:hypothetical protein